MRTTKYEMGYAATPGGGGEGREGGVCSTLCSRDTCSGAALQRSAASMEYHAPGCK